MGEEILKELEKRLEKALEVVKKDLSSVRTGRAKPSLVEDVKVEAYGAIMTIKELATITTPDSSLILIAPWDKSVVAAIASGIQKAELNIQPIVDGESIKISIPAPTEERRLELVKMVMQKIESGRVLFRQVRTEIKSEIEELKGEGGVSEDDIKSWLERMQKSVDNYMQKLDELGKSKEEELLTI